MDDRRSFSTIFRLRSCKFVLINVCMYIWVNLLTRVVLPEGCAAGHDVNGWRRVAPLGLVRGAGRFAGERRRCWWRLSARWLALGTVLAFGTHFVRRGAHVLCAQKSLFISHSCGLDYSTWLWEYRTEYKSYQISIKNKHLKICKQSLTVMLIRIRNICSVEWYPKR